MHEVSGDENLSVYHNNCISFTYDKGNLEEAGNIRFDKFVIVVSMLLWA